MKKANLIIGKTSKTPAILKHFILIIILIAGFIFMLPAKTSAQAGKALVTAARLLAARQAAQSAAKAAAKTAARRAAAKRAAALAARRSVNRRYNPGKTKRPPSQRYNRATLVNFCNYTGQPTLQVAIGHAVSDGNRNEWISRGWYQIPDGTCRTISLGGYQGYVYAYAVNQDCTLEWRGNHQFYVDWYNGFSLNQADYGLERNKNYKLVGMSEFRVGPGINNYNYR